MAEPAAADQTSVVLKGRMLTLTVLEIRSDDITRIQADAAHQAARTPDFFAQLPVLLSITGACPDLSRLVSELQALNLFVAGVLDADERTATLAFQAGLGVTQTANSGASRETASDVSGQQSEQGEGRSGPATAERSAGAARVVSQPVRSGQQIYARGGDLVVLDSVSAGAEIIADGHVHVYGTLRGRALAGAGGDRSARIFCRGFQPDLIAIAGCYKVADAIESSDHGRAVTVCLSDDQLLIEHQE